MDGGGRGVDRRGEARADADHARVVDAGLGQHVDGQALREVEAGERVLVDRAGLRALGHDPAAEIAYRGADMMVPEIQPHGEGRIGRERDLQRRAADHAALIGRAVGLLLDHAGALELGQDGRDRRPGEPEGAPQFAATSGGIAQKRL